MADKLTQMLLDALSRAALAPSGTPLFGSKSVTGLFPATASARQAAQRARDDSLICLVAPDPRGKTDHDLCAATDKGLAFLLQQTSPKQVLEDLTRAVEVRHCQVTEIVGATRQMQTELEALKVILTHMSQAALQGLTPLANNGRPSGAEADPTFSVCLQQEKRSAPPPSLHWLDTLRRHLADWSGGGDCPLPDLFRRLQGDGPALTIGQFHDGLRRLHEEEQVYLHPWTGPLYALPEPAYALLIGHEVAYYASARVSGQESGNSGPELSFVERLGPKSLAVPA